MINLSSNNVVVLNNGDCGVVVGFNGKPSYIVCQKYIRRMSQYDENGKCKSDAYSIKEVHDGSSIECVNDVFKKAFDVNALPIVN